MEAFERQIAQLCKTLLPRDKDRVRLFERSAHEPWTLCPVPASVHDADATVKHVDGLAVCTLTLSVWPQLVALARRLPCLELTD